MSQGPGGSYNPKQMGYCNEYNILKKEYRKKKYFEDYNICNKKNYQLQDDCDYAKNEQECEKSYMANVDPNVANTNLPCSWDGGIEKCVIYTSLEFTCINNNMKFKQRDGCEAYWAREF